MSGVENAEKKQLIFGAFCLEIQNYSNLKLKFEFEKTEIKKIKSSLKSGKAMKPKLFFDEMNKIG